MATIDNKYDWIGDYHQGVAIVVRNGKYGAIMVGGKEIFPPIYDAFIDFENGLAKAKYKGKNRTVNLSGQVQVKKGKEYLFLPEEYDWGFDFVKGLCVVLKNERYGIIDKDFKCIVEPQYVSYEGFHKGFAFFKKDSTKPYDAVQDPMEFEDTNLFPPEEQKEKFDIIDTVGNVVFTDVTRLDNGFCTVTAPSIIKKWELEGGSFFEFHPYGLIDDKFNIVYPIEYDHIEQIHSKLCFPTNSFFILGKNGISTIFDQKGVEYFSLKDNEKTIEFLQIGRLVVFKTKSLRYAEECYRLNIYDNKGVEIYAIDGNIRISGVYCILLESVYGNLFRLDKDGLWLADLQYKELKNAVWIYAKDRRKYDKELYRRINVFSRDKYLTKVSVDYFYYEYTYVNDKFYIVEDKRTLYKGIADNTGRLMVEPQYIKIDYIDKEKFIGIKLTPKKDTNYAYYGVFNSLNKEILPFEYSYLGIIDNHGIAFSQGDYKVAEKKLLNRGHYYYSIFGATNALGLMDLDLKVICSPKYKIIEKFIDYAFYKVGTKLNGLGMELYGILDISGIEIVPPKFQKIEKSNSPNYIAVVYWRREDYYNNVDKDGMFVVTSPEKRSFLISSHQYDWCGNFNSDGYAAVLKDGLLGKINANGHLISIRKKELIEVPDAFDWAYDFVDRFAVVKIGSYWGVVDEDFNIVIDCCYEKISLIHSDYFCYVEKGKCGIVRVNNKIVIPADYMSIVYLSNGLFKVQSTYESYGMIDDEGKIVVHPCYSNIIAIKSDKIIYWLVTQNNKKGVVADGKVIVPIIYDDIKYLDTFFECKITGKYRREDKVFKYNFEGQIVLDYCGTLINVPKDYTMGFGSSVGLFRVLKGERWGILNQKNELVYPCEYSYIGDFNNGLALVANGNTVYYDLQETYPRWGLKYGIINTLGNIVLPIEYDYIEQLDYGYCFVVKDNKYTLLSPCLNPIFATSDELEKLDDKYVLIKRTGHRSFLYGLIDYHGNVIVPLDDEHGSIRIEILNNGFIKVTYYKWNNNGYIAILNCQGRAVYENRDCDDIFYVGFGLFCVKSNEYIGERVCDTYRLINIQGKDILYSSYRQINVKDNGTINIQGNDGWGVADLSGNIIICPNYCREILFKDGFADVEILDSSLTQKINERGIVIVHNGKDEIELPENVYWGTDYVNGLSIVRRKGRGCHVIGVVDIKGNMIIPAQFKSVTLLSDNTIRVKDGDCYGLFDLNGKTILPPIFTDINYIAKDRILVEWNLNIAKEWDNTGYIPGNSYTKYKGSDGDLDYRACNRSALCNSKGEIINDKELSYVENFVNNYAKAYKKIVKGKIKLNTKIEVIEVDAIKYRQVGVIDLSGNTIVQPIYDSIVLYKKSAYAKVCKDGKYGIIHLPSNSIKMYDDVLIKHMWDVDALGRCVYSEDCEYDDNSDDWIGGTRGVLNPQGVLVLPGKYTDIRLIDNGLIEVSNDDGNLYGLLDKDGKEILPIKYTYISSFKGNYATICIGGEEDYYSNRMIKGGKWGVIDNTGKFVKECISDDEEKLVNENVFNDNRTSNCHPSVILSDSISEPKENYSYDYGHDSYRDDDDEGPYSKYGGYNGWDDNTIDEAFDGNPELTWNID